MCWFAYSKNTVDLMIIRKNVLTELPVLYFCMFRSSPGGSYFCLYV